MPKTLTNKVEFPIGDWSGDGHDRCEYFQYRVNKTVEELREIHFAFEERSQKFLEKLCAKYQDPSMHEHQIEKLMDIGFISDETEVSKYVADTNYLSWKEMADLWLALLKFQEPTLEYEYVEPEKVPRISFYGFDEKGRHIRFVGYGLFD